MQTITIDQNNLATFLTTKEGGTVIIDFMLKSGISTTMEIPQLEISKILEGADFESKENLEGYVSIQHHQSGYQLDIRGKIFLKVLTQAKNLKTDS